MALFCRDPLTKELKKLGYSVVQLPRADIEPLDLLGVEGGTHQIIGKLENLWAVAPAAAISVDKGPASTIQVTKTQQLQASFALELLGTALGLMSVDAAKVKAAYDKAKLLLIRFNEPQYRRANLVEIGDQLLAADLKLTNPVIRHHFLEGMADAYLIVETLVSNSITVEAYSDRKTQLELNTKLIGEIASADVQAQASNTEAGTVTYTGKKPVTFAFQARRMVIEKGVWAIEGVNPHLKLSDPGDIPAAEPLEPDRLVFIS